MLNDGKLNFFLKKNRTKKIVLCHGVFDVVHIGHINYLKEAKSFGNKLIVSVTSKKFVNKGSGRPIFNDSERVKFLKSISFIDYVHINYDYNAISLIEKVKPSFYCKGKEYLNFKNDLTNNIKKEVETTRRNGGIFKIVNTKTFSSSSLINENFKNYNNEQKKILSTVKKDLHNNKINKIKENLKKLSVTVIGEAIIDEYVFSETIGKSGKDPMLVTKKIKSTKFLGGALSVANIMACFVKKVTIITYLGQNDSQIPWIKKNLAKNIKIKFVKKNNSPTIYKKRYIDNYFGNKIFGSYKINNNLINFSEESKIIKFINEVQKKDIFCVIDYGHGLFTEKICNKINKLQNLKSLNVQFNSFNLSYQKISKFKNFDLACFNQKEIFYELKKHENSNEINDLTKDLSISNNFKKTVISFGKDGSKLYDRELKKLNTCPGFIKIAKDRIGAGDSLFALITILNKLKISNDSTLLLGNYLALLSLENNGPIQSINSNHFFKHFEHFIK
jgi:rfaE bifunctional protein nucleotidyltransferase chain/domain